jgi:digeranylgeranylglycerophospholipid reductase
MGVERPQVLSRRGHRSAATPDFDVVIIGGGPAGLLAARQLASAGFHAIVLEEHAAIGSPVHCTGVLGLDAFAELQLSRGAIVGAAKAARFISPNGTNVGVDVANVRAAVVDRALFDRELAAAATAAGAVIRTGTRAESVVRTPDLVAVATASGDVTGRAAVLACGASYRFSRALGLGLPGVLVHSAQLETSFPTLDEVEVHFGRDVAPGGFGWIVPFVRDGAPRARVGLLCDRDAGTAFRAFSDRIRRAHAVTERWPAPRLKVLPLAPIARTWTDRVLAIGDAAGLVKPTTGGGIYYGLLTGHLAAEVLSGALRENRLTGNRLREYEKRWRARLGPEIRAGLAFRSVASRLGDGAIDRLMELARVDGIVPLLKQTADFNWHRTAARALLRHAEFRRIVMTSLWS